MSELLYQSIHTGLKIDEAVTKVPILEAQINTLDAEVDAHKVEVLAQLIRATRDATLDGVQQIVTSKKVKMIHIRSNIGGQKVFSVGSWTPNRQSTTYVDGTTWSYYEVNDFTICIQPSGGNYVLGKIQNITNNSFEILWTKNGTGATGTIVLSIDLIYHGE